MDSLRFYLICAAISLFVIFACFLYPQLKTKLITITGSLLLLFAVYRNVMNGSSVAGIFVFILTLVVCGIQSGRTGSQFLIRIGIGSVIFGFITFIFGGWADAMDAHTDGIACENFGGATFLGGIECLLSSLICLSVEFWREKHDAAKISTQKLLGIDNG